MEYPITNIFYSLQGEGLFAGVPMAFIRLAGCNLSCAFCDTDYTVKKRMSTSSIARTIESIGPPAQRRAVITGGEPTIHDLSDLCRVLCGRGWMLHLETNGTGPLEGIKDYLSWVAVSPKEPLEAVSPSAIGCADEIKFVCGFPGWERYIDEFLNAFDSLTSKTNLLLTPITLNYRQGTGTESDFIEENIRTGVEYCLQHPRFRLCCQLHKVLHLP